MTQEIWDCTIHGESAEPGVVKDILVPETVGALSFSCIQKESVSTLWNSKHVLSVHKEAQADWLVVKSWAWFKEKGIIVIDDSNYLVIWLDFNSERRVLNHILVKVLACNGGSSLLYNDSICRSSGSVSTIRTDSCELQVFFKDGNAGIRDLETSKGFTLSCSNIHSHYSILVKLQQYCWGRGWLPLATCNNSCAVGTGEGEGDIICTNYQLSCVYRISWRQS